MKTAFLFSGQGAQVPGMMKNFFESSEAVKAVFDTADRVLGRSISDLCFAGSQDDLNLTHNTQPCVLAVDLAAYAAISEHGIKPDAVAGFSLGEYAALAAADVISIEDAFRIIQIRADAMQEAVPVGKGAMAVIMKLTPDEVQALCDEVDGYITPVNFNSPTQTVVSGEAEAVNRLLSLTKERKIKAMKLPVSAPFHCKLMKPAAEKLRELFGSISFRDANVPIYMNTSAEPESKADSIAHNIIMQTTSPVLWSDTLNHLYYDGIRRYVELGPGSTLAGFVKKTLINKEDISVYSTGTFDDIKQLNNL